MFDRRTLIAIAIFFSIFLGLNAVGGYRLPFVPAIVLYLFIYFLVSRLYASPASVEAFRSQQQEWPTSGPIGRYGQKGLILVFTITGMLGLLNPFLLIQIIRQGLGNSILKLTVRLNGDKFESYESELKYSLPFEGNWFVYNGGTQPSNSHSWDVITQRYAYDFVIADENRIRHTSSGTQLNDYFCYDKNICAAAAGKVVKVVDGIKPAPFVGYGIADFACRNFVGNHIIIEHTANEYGLYAHLINGSIGVREGEVVSRGQFVGKCGHSGYSSEPHLHFHLQNKKDFYMAVGLPITFSSIRIDENLKQNVRIQAGQFVMNGDSL